MATKVSINRNVQLGSASFPLMGILGIVFITLKLCNVIDWSWWWVLSPFWIGIAAALGIIAMILIISIIIAFLEWISK